MIQRFVFGGAAAAALTLLAVSAVPQAALDMDNPWHPLPEGEGVMEVYYACSACHSLRTVTNGRYSRAVWDELLTWMVEEQGMPEFIDSEERQMVLNYLATNLAPEDDGGPSAGTAAAGGAAPTMSAPMSPW